MLKYFLILFLLSSVHLFAQDDETKSQAEKTADSILNEFKNLPEKDFDATSEEEQNKLIAADEKYMDEFLNFERDRKEAKRFRTYLQLFLGIGFLIFFMMAYRNMKKRKLRRNDSPPGLS